MKLQIEEIKKEYVTITWDEVRDATEYRIFWADADHDLMEFAERYRGKETRFTFKRSTHIPYYFYGETYKNGKMIERSEKLVSTVTYTQKPQLEKIGRGLIAVKTSEGIFLGWRMLLSEVTGAEKDRLLGTDYNVYRNGSKIAFVTDSTNFLDKDGKESDVYYVTPVKEGVEGEKSNEVKAFAGGNNYIEIPMTIPEGGVTPRGEAYTYSVNDMSIGDADGDGEYEFYVKWDPSNSKDVSHRGYTGNVYIDCYKLSGQLLWRLDMGRNIRAGAHYTEFVVFDFDGDGKAEMSVKTAPGTKITRFDEKGNIVGEQYITIPEKDVKAGVTHDDNYVCSAKDYYEYTVERFMNWRKHPEVASGNWPDTLEECFGIPGKFDYPLSREDAESLADYFMDVWAPGRSDKNLLREFEGFIFKGPEYLSMFSGDGKEIETIDFPVPRGDDGLMWGDYAWNRVEPCNRVDRFQSAVAYLDGEKPSLIICRGYYTRTTITAYAFENGKHVRLFKVDSGHVPLDNPFLHHSSDNGTDPVYGCISGQGDHSLSVADIDGDGKMEIIYGSCAIDHDGSVLYSSRDRMPDGRLVKLGHGDSMHVAKIDPDRPGFQIFNVYEGGSFVPYGYALRDAETGKVIFGEPGNRDLGRCMIGDINPDVRGIQVWVSGVRDCKGNFLEDKALGTNFSVKWAADLSTQVTDGVDYLRGQHVGTVHDNTHGVMLKTEDVSTNNGTKGNPCLVADIFGDHREEIILRKNDSSAVRIYTNTEISTHKLFTLLQDPMYRCGVAWQQNVYNQPCYTSFYYASDMDFREVIPWLSETGK